MTPETTYRRLPSNASLPAAAATEGWSLPRALIVMGLLAVLAALALFSGGDLSLFASFETGLAIPGLLFTALLVVRERPWTFLAAGITVALLPILMLFPFGAIATLASPTAGGSYASTVLMLLALLLALPAGIKGYRASKRGRELPRLRGSIATRQGLVALVVGTMTLTAAGVGLLAGAQAGEGGAGVSYDFAPTSTVAVKVERFAFAPKAVPLSAGAIEQLVVENRDAAFHTFTYKIGDKVYNHDLPGRSTTSFLVKLDTPGTIQYWCEPHSGGPDGQRTGMVGEIVVA